MLRSVNISRQCLGNVSTKLFVYGLLLALVLPSVGLAQTSESSQDQSKDCQALGESRLKPKLEKASDQAQRKHDQNVDKLEQREQFTLEKTRVKIDRLEKSVQKLCENSMTPAAPTGPDAGVSRKCEKARKRLEKLKEKEARILEDIATKIADAVARLDEALRTELENYLKRYNKQLEKFVRRCEASQKR